MSSSGNGFNSSLRDSRVPNNNDDQRRTNGDRDAWNNPIKNNDNNNNNNNNNNQNNNNNNNNQNNNNTNNNTNNDQSLDTMVDKIWEDIVNNKDDTNNNNTNNNTNNNNNNNTNVVSPADQLTKYLADNGLGDFTLSDKEKEELQGGNFDSLTKRTLELVQNAHTKALSGANTMIKSEVKRALEEARNETKSIMQGTEAIKALNLAIPATKNPAIGPVAATVMQRFLDRGLNQEQAIQGVKQWFTLTAKEMGYTENNVNSNRNGSFSGGQNSENQGEQNWINVLNGSKR